MLATTTAVLALLLPSAFARNRFDSTKEVLAGAPGQSFSVPFKAVSHPGSGLASKDSTSSNNGAPQKSAVLLATVQLGSQQTSLDVLLDTSSTLFWVSAAECISGCTNKAYDPNRSSNGKITGFRNQSITYPDGSVVACSVYTDSLTVGSVQISSQGICVADSYTSLGGNAPYDGVMGIGNNLADPTNHANAPASILNGFVDKKVSFFYNRQSTSSISNTETSNAGEITFGTPNAARYTGSINWIPIAQTGTPAWGLSITTVTAGAFSATAKAGAAIVVDTGYPYFALDTTVAAQINKALGFSKASDGLYEITCSALTTSSSFPTLQVNLGGVGFTLGVGNIVLNNNGRCVSGIVETSSINILGTVFLRNFHLSVDYTASSVGFATSTDGWTGQGLPVSPPSGILVASIGAPTSSGGVQLSTKTIIIIGASVGGVLVLGIIGGIAYVFARDFRRRKQGDGPALDLSLDRNPDHEPIPVVVTKRPNAASLAAAAESRPSAASSSSQQSKQQQQYHQQQQQQQAYPAPPSQYGYAQQPSPYDYTPSGYSQPYAPAQVDSRGSIAYVAAPPSGYYVAAQPQYAPAPPSGYYQQQQQQPQFAPAPPSAYYQQQPPSQYGN